MNENTHTYRVIDSDVTDVIFKEKSSKFIGFATYVEDENQIKNRIEQIKKLHFSARHWCYAWQLGLEDKRYRVNDDGEPNGTAGLPIYGQIQSFGLTNILIVVVRYFGGIKLGVGGLVQAYKTTAKLTLDMCCVLEKSITYRYMVVCSYQNLNKVMRIVKEKKIEIHSEHMDAQCTIVLDVEKDKVSDVESAFSSLFDIVFKPVIE